MENFAQCLDSEKRNLHFCDTRDHNLSWQLFGTETNGLGCVILQIISLTEQKKRKHNLRFPFSTRMHFVIISVVTWKVSVFSQSEIMETVTQTHNDYDIYFGICAHIQHQSYLKFWGFWITQSLVYFHFGYPKGLIFGGTHCGRISKYVQDLPHTVNLNF